MSKRVLPPSSTKRIRPNFEQLEFRTVPSLTLAPLVGLESAIDVSANAVAVDAAGDTFVAGTFVGAVSVDPSGKTFIGSAGLAEEGYLVKYSPSGSFLWAWKFYDTRNGLLPGGGSGAADGLALDRQGNPYVVGSVGTNAFIEKFDGQTGNATFFNWINGGSSEASAVAVDGSGNAYVTGSFSGTLTPGSSVPNVAALGKQDIFVAKFSSSLIPLRLTGIGGSGDTDSGTGIAVDSGGNVYLTGTVRTTAFPSLIYIAKLNSSGSVLWSGSYGDGSASGVVLDSLGNVDVVGTLTGSATFIGSVGTVPSPGTSELFVVALKGLNGSSISFASIRDPSSTAGGSGIAIDGSNTLYVTGYEKTSISPHGLQDVIAAEISETFQVVASRRYADVSGTASGTAIAANAAGQVAMVGYFEKQFGVDTGNFPTGTAGTAHNAFVASSGRVSVIPPQPSSAPSSNLLPLSTPTQPFGLANFDLATAEATGLYQIILGRFPEATGLAAASAALRGGLPVGQLAQDLLYSAEYESRVVASYYQKFLGRTASSAEVFGWVSLMQGGMTEEQVATNFLASQEYSLRYSSDSAFTGSLYVNLLGRQASSAEIQATDAAIEGGGLSRRTLAFDFVDSAESKLLAIKSDYAAILGRKAEASAINSALASLQSGSLTIESLALSLAGSDEYRARAGSTVVTAPPPSSGGLYPAYKGGLYDTASDTNGHSSSISPSPGGSNFYLASIHSYSDPEGDNVAGNLTINSWVGDVIVVPFVGVYSNSGSTLDISNMPGVQAGNGGVTFQFNFTIKPDGSLLAQQSSLTTTFNIYDGKNGLSDYGSSTGQVTLAPNPSGLP